MKLYERMLGLSKGCPRNPSRIKRKNQPEGWSFAPLMTAKMVGDPGIEPGMSRLGGVTVRC
ncbi:MAG: hypothetical protein ACO22Z_11125, partial [Paracoccaceae bacterium]